MKQCLILLVLLCLHFASMASGKVSLRFFLDAGGTPFYCVLLDNDTVVSPSRLGLMTETDSLCSSFQLENVYEKDFDVEH